MEENALAISEGKERSPCQTRMTGLGGREPQSTIGGGPLNGIGEGERTQEIELSSPLLAHPRELRRIRTATNDARGRRQAEEGRCEDQIDRDSIITLPPGPITRSRGRAGWLGVVTTGEPPPPSTHDRAVYPLVPDHRRAAPTWEGSVGSSGRCLPQGEERGHGSAAAPPGLPDYGAARVKRPDAGVIEESPPSPSVTERLPLQPQTTSGLQLPRKDLQDHLDDIHIRSKNIKTKRKTYHRKNNGTKEDRKINMKCVLPPAPGGEGLKHRDYCNYRDICPSTLRLRERRMEEDERAVEMNRKEQTSRAQSSHSGPMTRSRSRAQTLLHL